MAVEVSFCFLIFKIYKILCTRNSQLATLQFLITYYYLLQLQLQMQFSYIPNTNTATATTSY